MTPTESQNILIADPIHPDALAALKAEGFVVDLCPDDTPEQLLEKVAGYDAIIGRTSTSLDATLLSAATKLRCIGVHATGWNHIDVATATNNNVAILGYPSDKSTVADERLEGAFIPTAEHVMLGMLAAAGNFCTATTSLKEKRWEKYNLVGTELYGKTLGIIGLGRIGSLVAERAEAFGMRVIAHHPNLSSAEAAERHAELVPISDLYTESDYITVHVPQRPETINLIDAAALTQMKPTAVLINTARAPIVNDTDLLTALNNNTIAGAVIDVFGKYPDGVNWELVQHPKVIATPHIAGVSHESLKRVSTYITTSVTDYLKHGKIRGLINPEITT